MQQMSSFSRSMDGLVTGYVQRATTGAVLTGSDKENTPCDIDVKSASATHFALAMHGATPVPPDLTRNLGDAFTVSMSDAVTSSMSEELESIREFQVPPAISDVSRQRRKRSGRNLRNRNSVPEEVIVERGDDTSGAPMTLI